MSEETKAKTEASQEGVQSAPQEAIKLDGLLAFKVGMTSIYSESGEMVPVTILRYETCVVSDVKTKDKHGYEAIQLACVPQKAKNASKPETKRLASSGFENGAKVVKEIRVRLPESIRLGARVALDSLQEGDSVKLVGTSKGRGFMGSVRRWNFAGGPAAHGSKFHRKPGSSGNRTWPGRVMPGKKFPGHWGDERVTVKNVQIFKVLPEESLVLVRGPVPGSRNSLVSLVKG